MTLAQLKEDGFDLSTEIGQYGPHMYQRVRCSKCKVSVIDDVAKHARGCPNRKKSLERNNMDSDKTRGQIGYEAYAKSTGGKTFDGRDMPTWKEVEEKSPKVAEAWEYAAQAILDDLIQPHDRE